MNAKKSRPLFVIVTLLLFVFNNTSAQLEVFVPDTVSITVDINKTTAPLTPIWAFFGYDEPNYTYMKNGKKLLSEIAELSKQPVYVRTHSLLVTGDGKAALKWGSTNAYTEDENGKPIYNWTIIDSIFDTYVERGMKPIAEIGFTPKALSTHPEPYQHHWSPKDKYGNIFTGWAYPPNDYKKYAQLVFEWVQHSVKRYGKKEVETWLWEVWNEPDIDYWKGTTEEYLKLYDYVADAVKRALPAAKIGGPATTGPGSANAAKFLKTFLDHVANGKNYVTSKRGSPIDFITYHAKGQPELINGTVQMNMGKQLRDIDKGFEILTQYSALKKLPVIITESDPEGCAACSEDFNPQNAYRNGTMYASYTAASFARKYDIAANRNINLKGAVTWAFEFEDQPWFRGFRDLATNGVDKPVLNVFRMFGLMQGKRVTLNKNLAYNYATIRDSSVRSSMPDVNALATSGEHSASVMVWNYHDVNNTDVEASPVTITLQHLTAKHVLIHHYRIDKTHSNAYELWKKIGAPQSPTKEEIVQLEQAGQLQLLTSPEWRTTQDGELHIQMSLPRQGVSLIQITW